jgi:hypothetical protein
MDQKDIQKLIQRKQVEESIRQEFEGTLPERVTRYLEVKPHPIIPNTPFAAPSDECSLLFRDGHFYACIALTQAVAEAIVRHLCERNRWSPDKDFERNLDKLTRRGFISNELKQSFLSVWGNRNDYHHLNPSVETDRQRLQQLAREKAQLLAGIESEIFAFEVVNGELVPKHPKYWDIGGKEANVFLRLEP